MKTVILMWNPTISSFRMEDFRKCIQVLKNHVGEDKYFWGDEDNPKEMVELNWSIWDYKEVEYGDRFYMIRVGEGNTGLVMAGTINSNPYKGEDWSGKGRKVFYCDLLIEAMIDSERMPYISTQELAAAMPGFDWTGGHSGRVIGKLMGDKIEAMWQEYLYKYIDVFDFDKGARTIASYEIPTMFENLLSKRIGNTCEICGYDYKTLWGADCDLKNAYVRYIPISSDVRCRNGDDVWKHIHCVCYNCNRMPYEEKAKKLGEEDYIADDDY